MTTQQAQRLAEKVLAGEANQEETAALRSYIHEQKDLPGLTDQLLPLTALQNIPDSPLPAGMEEKILRSVIGEIHSNDAVIKRPSFVRRLSRIAAAAAILIGVCLIAYRFLPDPFSTNIPVAVLDSVSTPMGVMKEITLTDGSRIRLNGGTTLKFPRAFAGKTRDVFLDGEAFFDVRKNAQQPFVIHTADIITTVLGTSFNINSSREHQRSEVAVATGKVRVHLPGKGLQDSVAYLLPGEKASYHATMHNGLLTGATPIASVGSWQRRGFYYDQAPLPDILKDLERSYGVHFIVKAPAIQACTFSVTFKEMTLEDILHSLTLMSSVRFLQKGKTIEVLNNTCN